MAKCNSTTIRVKLLLYINAKIFSNRYRLSVGLCGVIQGTLPIGGLSSSAAVTLVFLEALCKVNGIYPTDLEKIK